MNARLQDLKVGEIFQMGLHEFIGDALGKTNTLAGEIADAYHF